MPGLPTEMWLPRQYLPNTSKVTKRLTAKPGVQEGEPLSPPTQREYSRQFWWLSEYLRRCRLGTCGAAAP
jgi:hypothetical protein